MRTPTIALLLSLAASPALTAVPVTDAARLAAEGTAAETTERTERTQRGSNAARTGSLCSVWRGGSGPQSSLDGNRGITDMIRRIAREEGVREDIALAIAYQESRFNPCAKSPVGATGIMQLMPGTAADLGVDPYDPEQNIRGGLRYFKTQLKKFGSVELALAAYNAGPGNVTKYGGVPPFKETQGYVANITERWTPSFGGLPQRDDVSGARAAALADPSMHAGGIAAANGDSFGDVRRFLEGKGQEAMRAGSLLDSVDANSDARLANVEMWNRLIFTSAAFVEVLNALQTQRLGQESGAAEVATYHSNRDPVRDPREPGDRLLVVIGTPDGLCEATGVEGTIDPDCSGGTADGGATTVETHLDALVAATLADRPGGETHVSATPNQ